MPLPPRLPSGTSRPSPYAFLIAAVLLKPQYRAAWAVVIGPSRTEHRSVTVESEAFETPSAHSSSRTPSRIISRRYSSKVTSVGPSSPFSARRAPNEPFLFVLASSVERRVPHWSAS